MKMISLLHIEAVNQRWVIDDTEDLSTRRGGSLMLLDAIDHIQKKFTDKIDVVSSGASIGLFKFKSGQDVLQVAAEVRAALAPAPYCHATFMVHVVSDVNFDTAVEAAVAATRWTQMQSLSFSAAGLHAQYPLSGPRACTIDDVRPAAENHLYKKQECAVSASVHARRTNGKTKKHVFYRKLLADMPGIDRLSFTNDLEDLSAGTQSEQGFLAGKIAVLYADGNKFGDIQRACKSAAALSEWDDYVRNQRKILLQGILERAAGAPDWTTDEGRMRFETLLWGGDELTFVVPAWVGLALAEWFFELTRHMAYPDEQGHQRPLTHGLGLVFCHHNAPIGRIRKLAESLAGKCKTISRKRNLLAWATLESFDHTGVDLDGYLARRYCGRLVDDGQAGSDAWKNLVLDPGQLSAIRTCLPGLKDALPRSAMIRTLRAMLAAPRAAAPHRLVQRAYDSVKRGVAGPDTGTGDLDALWRHLYPHDFSGNREFSATPSEAHIPAWIILLELWDYATSSSANGKPLP